MITPLKVICGLDLIESVHGHRETGRMRFACDELDVKKVVGIVSDHTVDPLETDEDDQGLLYIAAGVVTPDADARYLIYVHVREEYSDKKKVF